MQICIPNAWNPRPYQRRLWDYFAKGGRRAVAVWHRRCGKDSLALNLEASKALTERVGAGVIRIETLAAPGKAVHVQENRSGDGEGYDVDRRGRRHDNISYSPLVDQEKTNAIS